MTRALSRQEIEDLTGKRTGPAQSHELSYLGIDFRIRSNGTIVVIDEDLPLRYPKQFMEDVTIRG